jgi:2-polyprenyl-3-methyl-5-hydroxy-6-metoxy-1,4-benzoquinol methylase
MTRQRQASCPSCAAPSPLAFLTRDRNHRVDGKNFAYHHCPACGMVFINPLPDDLGRYYPTGYQQLPASVAELAVWAESERHKLEVLTAHAPPGRLCEIGPSNGAFAYLAQQAGYVVEAIEMDGACCAFLREALGIPVVHTADTVAALAALAPCDAIAMWHVIEHLSDPWRTLAVAAGRLRPGGVLILAAPNPAAFQFAVLGGRWAHVDAPRHVRLFPMSLLRERLAASGLSQVHATTSDAAARGWDRFGWEHSLMAYARRPPARRLLGIAGRCLAWLAAPLDRRPGRGSAYTMVFRKEGA